jgi:hypothetical protein
VPQKSEKQSHPDGVAFLLGRRAFDRENRTFQETKRNKLEKNVNKQEAMATIMKCAEELEHAPSQTELTKLTNVSRRQIRRYFGSYTGALRECGLQRHGGGYRVELEDLFRDWAGIVRKLGKLPSLSEYEYVSSYSHTPLTSRYGGWTKVPAAMKQFAEKHGLAEEWSDVLKIIAEEEQEQAERARLSGAATGPRKGARVLMNQPIYGPMMRPYPLMHGPMNEDGVIFLFGAMAEDLGYVVLKIQGAFPDCEALRQIDGDLCQRVRIEFEHQSRNFLIHGHDVSGADAIVCWEHNWPECPLEVIELKEEVRKKLEKCKECQKKKS